MTSYPPGYPPGRWPEGDQPGEEPGGYPPTRMPGGWSSGYQPPQAPSGYPPPAPGGHQSPPPAGGYPPAPTPGGWSRNFQPGPEPGGYPPAQRPGRPDEWDDGSATRPGSLTTGLVAAVLAALAAAGGAATVYLGGPDLARSLMDAEIRKEVGLPAGSTDGLKGAAREAYDAAVTEAYGIFSVRAGLAIFLASTVLLPRCSAAGRARAGGCSPR
ncbi:MAG: hypothetical protein HYR62_09110 [Actinobacteria bacterium]|nr:hypothetical protein [Actinomycetota bacterium]MBI3688601.1 hypothetical protein [Actinomycetota bacterium]